MTTHDRDFQAKLDSLKKDFDENEQQMRQAAIKYEDLIARKESLSAEIAELKKAKGTLRPQSPSP
jgi:multidrug resistance efflux pump